MKTKMNKYPTFLPRAQLHLFFHIKKDVDKRVWCLLLKRQPVCYCFKMSKKSICSMLLQIFMWNNKVISSLFHQSIRRHPWIINLYFRANSSEKSIGLSLFYIFSFSDTSQFGVSKWPIFTFSFLTAFADMYNKISKNYDISQIEQSPTTR